MRRKGSGFGQLSHSEGEPPGKKGRIDRVAGHPRTEVLQIGFVITRNDRDILRYAKALALEECQDGQNMGGSCDEDRARRRAFSEKGVEKGAEMIRSAIVFQDREMDRPAAGKRLTEAFLALRFSSGSAFRETKHDVLMPILAQEASGMAAGRPIVEIDRGQGDAGRT